MSLADFDLRPAIAALDRMIVTLTLAHNPTARAAIRQVVCPFPHDTLGPDTLGGPFAACPSCRAAL